jgi:hypothetical protein
MSFDPWGGGSDRDPKLRLRELREAEERKSLSRSRVPAPERSGALKDLGVLAGVVLGVAAAMAAAVWLL